MPIMVPPFCEFLSLSRLLAFVWVTGLVACSPFKGLQADRPTDQAVAVGDCFKVQLYQPAPEEQQHVLQALEAVCTVFRDTEFQRRVRAVERWMTHPDLRIRGDLVVTGDEVVQTVLKGPLLPAHIISWTNTNANATTSVCRKPNVHAVSMDPKLIAQWKAQRLDKRAELLNTLAHEASHLAVGNPKCGCTEDNQCNMRYTDDGHDDCTDRYLVSYHVGDMVECHVKHEKDESAFWACVDKRRPAASAGCTSKMARVWKERDSDREEAPPVKPQKTASASLPVPQPPAECLGRRLPIKLASNMPYTAVTFTDGASFQGDFVLDLGSNASYIDPGAFASPGQVLMGCNQNAPCSFTAGEVLGKPDTLRFLWKDYKDRDYGIRQAGMIGTDFTSESVVTLHYSGSSVFVSPKDTFCSDDQLKAHGLAPMSTEGYYSNSLAKLRRASEVSALPVEPDKDQVTNIPAPMIRLAGVTLPAQLDTGFDDRAEAYSVNVNIEWLKAVQGAQPALLERAAEKPLSTCVDGISEKSVKYKRRDGKPIKLEMLNNRELLRTFAAAVFVKETPPEALQCGGIGTWKIPAAQIGASYFKALDLVVFDPFTSRIWVPRAPTP